MIEKDSAVTTVSQEPAVVAEIIETIRRHDEMLIVGHLRPDGDCLGSCLGLQQLLEAEGKKVEFYTAGPLPDFFRYLKGFEKIRLTPPEVMPPLVIFVDSADPDRVNDGFMPNAYIINIDHHLSNTNYGQLNWVDIEATAAGEQIYRLALAMDREITPEIATCLYTALMTDTGGFRFSNTDEMTFQAASHLVKSGANPAAIAEAVFESRLPSTVKATGYVYSSIKYECDGQFVWNELTQETLRELDIVGVEIEGLSSDLRAIQGVEVAILFYETEAGDMRIGFRSKGKVNVSNLAKLLNGGGHFCASGAFLKGPDYAKSREHALSVCREYIADALAAR